jgi:glucose dehydrogenase
VGSDGGLQVNPLVVGRVVYGYSPTLEVFALDGATGRQLWKFDSGIVGRQPSRGLSYWTDGKESRVFAYMMNFLHAMNPATGELIANLVRAEGSTFVTISAPITRKTQSPSPRPAFFTRTI